MVRWFLVHCVWFMVHVGAFDMIYRFPVSMVSVVVLFWNVGQLCNILFCDEIILRPYHTSWIVLKTSNLFLCSYSILFFLFKIGNFAFLGTCDYNRASGLDYSRGCNRNIILTYGWRKLFNNFKIICVFAKLDISSSLAIYIVAIINFVLSVHF